MLRSIVTLVGNSGEIVHLDFSTMHDAITVTIEHSNRCFLVPGVRMADLVLAGVGRGKHLDGMPEYCQCATCFTARVDKMASAIALRHIGRPRKE